MRSASSSHFSDPPASPLRRRTVGLGLVLAAHALVLVLLLRLAPPPAPPPPAVTAFELIPDPEARQPTVAKPKRVRKQPAPRTPAPLPPPTIELPYQIEGLITLTRKDYAAADIARLPSHSRATPSDQAESASAETAATGPNGERLYNAEWYREPTQAELAYYLPPGVSRPSWAMIACQTIDDYRVDNCVELGQSAPGSALAAAIREAAWQFRVWPPRLGGRPLVGAWVRIKIEFSEVAAQ